VPFNATIRCIFDRLSRLYFLTQRNQWLRGAKSQRRPHLRNREPRRPRRTGVLLACRLAFQRRTQRLQRLERLFIGNSHRLDVEALGLAGAEQLLDRPTLTVEADNGPSIGPRVDAWVVSRRQCAGSVPSGGSISRASTRVSATVSVSRVASFVGRWGRSIATWPPFKARMAVRAGRPGAPGYSIVTRASSGRSSRPLNSIRPSPSQRSCAVRVSNSACKRTRRRCALSVRCDRGRLSPPWAG